MKYRILLLTLCIALASCVKDEDLNGSGDGDKNPPQNLIDDIEPGIVRIKLKRDSGIADQIMIGQTRSGVATTGIPELDEIAERLGATKIERTFGEGGVFEERWRHAGLHLWYDIYFDETIPVTRATRSLDDLDIVEITEDSRRIVRMDYHTTPNPVPGATKRPSAMGASTKPSSNPRPASDYFNDPRLKDQWHYNNRGDLEKSVMGADINLFKAWEITTGHPDVIVSIVDGGVDFTHEDIAANMWTNAFEFGNDEDGNKYKGDIHGWNFVRDKNVITPDDHGTHVAGTVAAVNNNGIGVCGVAGGDGSPNTGVRIMSCQIFEGRKGATTANSKRAIVYGADNGAVISQNSWGYDGANFWYPSDREAIDYFVKYAGTDRSDPTGNTQAPGSPMKGGIVIFAAGNEKGSGAAFYPGAYEKTLSVGAITPDYKRSYYSNLGTWVDITAPGGDVARSGHGYPDTHAVLSLAPSNSYDYMSGTSMACPHVSGVAALVISRMGVGRKGFTNQELWDILIDSADPVLYNYNASYNGMMGGGLIDAYKAVNRNAPPSTDITPPSPVTDLTAIKWGVNSVELSWSATADTEDGKAYRYRVFYSKESLQGIDFSDPLLSMNNVDFYTGRKNVGDQITGTVTNMIHSTDYNLAIIAMDYSGNQAAPMFISGRTGIDNPPTLKPDTKISNISISEINGIYLLDIGNWFEDDLEIVGYSSKSSNDKIAISSVTDNQEKDEVMIKATGYGITEIIVTAIDSGDNKTSVTFKVMVRNNNQTIELYPNPVTTTLNLRMAEDMEAELEVGFYNSLGARVMYKELDTAPYSPGQIDVKELKPGKYKVVVKYRYEGLDGETIIKTSTKTITKL